MKPPHRGLGHALWGVAAPPRYSAGGGVTPPRMYRAQKQCLSDNISKSAYFGY